LHLQREVAVASEDYRVPVPPEVKRILNEVGRQIGEAMPPGWGFTLLMFTFNTGPGEGVMTYLSNAQREGVLKSMQEFLRAQGS
jgi:hypothetical protein